MKRILIRLLPGIVVFLIISGVVGYFYLKDMMKAPPNLLSVAGKQATINVTWTGDFGSREAMLLPVHLPDVSDTFHMQFDLGAVHSVLYRPAMQSIAEKYLKSEMATGRYVKDFELRLGSLSLNYDSIKTYNHGEAVNWTQRSPQIIGTIGADLIEKMKALVDFKNSLVTFFEIAPDSLVNHSRLTDFEFNERKVMLQFVLDGKEKTLMWDTGASAYHLITSKAEWEKMALNKEQVVPQEGNQLNRKLKVYTASSEKVLKLGEASLALDSVTYIEGFPWYIEMAFEFSGMEGMTGNKLFEERKIYMDAKNEKFILF